MKLILPALPLLFGFLLDACIGDPPTLPHPIRWIGNLIAKTETFIRKHLKNLRLGGFLLAVTVLLISGAVPAVLLAVCYKIHTVLGVVAESIMICYLLAARSLRDESMKVCISAENGDTEAARKAVSMIVGRDTVRLDEAGILRAAVETVAENASDGVTAPMFYIAFGWAVGGFLYKAANTMDSMIGYRNEKYIELGRFAARLDDLLNFIPSRVTALLMIAVSPLLKFDAANAYRIWKRDRRKHASPNSAQTESACAGALHLRLAGDAWYFGKLHRKPFIGDNDRQIEPEDIRRANRLMYCASVCMLILCCMLRCILFGGVLS
ncbi:MAG: cobalamin biosynthesis protein CobD [Oscillospiraceae bacterium]|nr:cobalamin biosynthesis protein CobD [Oscillospiraceae bacterium]MBR3420206.1 cobalamin biosynthesis protein CobD [Oscillospiraceae bacterium]